MQSRTLWAGRIMSALPVLLLLFSAAMKLLKLAPAMESMAKYGYPENLIVGIGALELLCSLVYLVPRTSFLGAILLTAYLGGATATNVRVGNPAFCLTVLLGVLVWGGLYLRDERLRVLIPLRNPD